MQAFFGSPVAEQSLVVPTAASTASMEFRKSIGEKARALWRLPLLALGLNLSEASELAALLEESIPQLRVRI